MTAMLNLNACQFGSTNVNNDNTGPNIWENPSVTGLNRLQPHSRNVRAMSVAYKKHLHGETEKVPIDRTINPCICLDSSSLDLQQSSPILSSKKGWQFRLFANPNCIPQNYILPLEQVGEEEKLTTWCEQSTQVPSNWTLIPSHKYRNSPSTATTNEEVEHNYCSCNIHDPPRYTNVQMPFYTLYPHVPEKNPTGVYRLEFTLTKRGVWLGSNDNNRRRVILHLGGVESCHFIYLNGKFVGMSKDSKLPSEYDVTSMIRCDDTDDGDNAMPSSCTMNENNTLVIIATKYSDASFLEQQDHWRGMGGIHRSIYVYSIFREAFVEDVFCKANLILQPTSNSTTTTTTDDCDDGDVFLKRCRGRIDVQARIGRGWDERVEGRNIYYNEQIPYTIKRHHHQLGGDDDRDDVVFEYKMLFQVYDPDNLPLFDEGLDVSAAEANPLIKDVHQRFNLLSFSAVIPGYVRAWSDESPTLYRLEATLVQQERGKNVAEDTVVVDSFSTTIGFRSVEIQNRQLLINGQPVLIKGVNRHDHSPTGGKAVTLDEIRQDLMLMKEYNFNAIRTAHYPNDIYLYDLADELGLYVVDEANIECHGHYDFICREHSFSAAMLDRVQRMVIRDQNHPSIIGWSLGNEAGFASNHTMLYGWIKGYDSSRFVQYEGAHRPAWGQDPHNYERKGMGTDIICPMYPSIEEITEWAEEIAPRIHETRPFIMCEYAHAMGHSSGSLADYWKVIKDKKGLQGGFIWDFVDQGLLEKDADGNEYFAYGGDYEETPHDANFNINGMIGPDRKPHPAMIEFKKIAQPVAFSFLLHADKNDVTICVTNQRYFSSLDDLQWKWALKMHGFILEEGTSSFPKLMKPKTTESVTTSALKNAFERHSVGTVIQMGLEEVHLDIGVFRVGRTTRIKSVSELEKYPEVASEQFAICTRRKGNAIHFLPETFHQGPTKQNLFEDDKLSLSSNSCRALLSKQSTSFEYVIDSKTLIFGIRPNLFRASTDNGE